MRSSSIFDDSRPSLSRRRRETKDLKIEDGSCQRRLPEVILLLEGLVRTSEPVDNGVLDLWTTWERAIRGSAEYVKLKCS